MPYQWGKYSPHAKNVYSGLSLAGAQRAYKVASKAYGAYFNPNSQKLNREVRSYKKGQRKYRYRRRRKRKVCVAKDYRVRKQVKELKRVVEGDQGTHIDRRISKIILSSAVNASNIQAMTLNDINIIEDVISNLKYYNPSIPGTLTTADGTSGTFQKEFYIKQVYGKCTLHNNYQVPVNATLYIIEPKEDTSIEGDTAFANGLTDMSNASATSMLVYPTDSPQFGDLWKITKSSRKIIQPGDSLSVSVSFDGFQYDPSFVDNHALVFQSRFKGCQALARIEGCFGHDTVASEITTLQSSVDIVYETKIVVKYPAGVDLKYLRVTNNLSTSFTNSGVHSNMPVSDNQTYSVI